jgi:hypothetical protein
MSTHDFYIFLNFYIIVFVTIITPITYYPITGNPNLNVGWNDYYLSQKFLILSLCVEFKMSLDLAVEKLHLNYY